MKTQTSNKQKTDASEKFDNSNSSRSDVKALKDQNKKTKDSDNKDKNAGNAKVNPGHYEAPKNTSSHGKSK